MKKPYSEYSYKQIDSDTIQFTRTEGESTEIGLIVKGLERTRANGETQETYSPWDELAALSLPIEPIEPAYEPTYREKRALRYSQD